MQTSCNMEHCNATFGGGAGRDSSALKLLGALIGQTRSGKLMSRSGRDTMGSGQVAWLSSWHAEMAT